MKTAEPLATAFAPAKINLTLHVTGQRADGYHLLDSLVAFADVGDRITVFASDDLRLEVSGPMAAGVPVDDSNLVLRAARLAGVRTARIVLDKHLPMAAGIGGGSSDAAAVLRALSVSHDAALPDARALGADVPVCLLGRTARMSGIGESVDAVKGLPPLWVALVNPGVALHTPDVFGRLLQKHGTGMPEIPQFAQAADCAAWLALQRNDLEAPAISLEPRVATVLDAIGQTGALLARMSGSGATCFGIYETAGQARDAAASIAASHPGWWVRAAQIGP